MIDLYEFELEYLIELLRSQATHDSEAASTTIDNHDLLGGRNLCEEACWKKLVHDTLKSHAHVSEKYLYQLSRFISEALRELCEANVERGEDVNDYVSRRVQLEAISDYLERLRAA